MNDIKKTTSTTEKKEISIKASKFKSILLIIFAPIILTFIIEHFGKFSYKGYGGVSLDEVRVNNLTFETLFGSSFSDNIRDKNIGYSFSNHGVARISPSYSVKFPYYIKGLFSDFIYPLTVIIIGLILFFINSKYRFSIVKEQKSSHDKES